MVRRELSDQLGLAIKIDMSNAELALRVSAAAVAGLRNPTLAQELFIEAQEAAIAGYGESIQEHLIAGGIVNPYTQRARGYTLDTLPPVGITDDPLHPAVIHAAELILTEGDCAAQRHFARLRDWPFWQEYEAGARTRSIEELGACERAHAQREYDELVASNCELH